MDLIFELLFILSILVIPILCLFIVICYATRHKPIEYYRSEYEVYGIMVGENIQQI